MVDCQEPSSTSILSVAAMVWLGAGVSRAAGRQDMMGRVRRPRVAVVGAHSQRAKSDLIAVDAREESILPKEGNRSLTPLLFPHFDSTRGRKVVEIESSTSLRYCTDA